MKTANRSILRLEKKRFSITRLKHLRTVDGTHLTYSWKEKILDYEIETSNKRYSSVDRLAFLEKKRFSITRLKLLQLGIQPYRIAWLEKKRFSITRLKRSIWCTELYRRLALEKKRFSITRLKRRDCSSARNGCPGAWKEKILDYEIETWSVQSHFSPGRRSWKEKILDYEIETATQIFSLLTVHRIDLKRKDSRLRDWNVSRSCLDSCRKAILKRKDSRLRDWNTRCVMNTANYG